MTAAVPQAKISTMSPLAAPSFHSWIGIRRSSGSRPISLASARTERAGDALEDRAGELGRDQPVVLRHEEQVHPAELLDVGVRRGVEEDGLVAAVLDALELAGEAGGVVAAALGGAGAAVAGARVVGATATA